MRSYPDFDGDEKPLPSWEELNANVAGLSNEQLETFRQRAVPEAGAALREAPADERRTARRAEPEELAAVIDEVARGPGG